MLANWARSLGLDCFFCAKSAVSRSTLDKVIFYRLPMRLRLLSGVVSHKSFEDMQISCILGAQEIGTAMPDLIVFPEGIDWPEIDQAYKLCPDAMIVAAVTEDGRSCGVLWYRGQKRDHICDDVAHRFGVEPLKSGNLNRDWRKPLSKPDVDVHSK